VSAEQRHGYLHEFLALTDGLSITAVARTLRCCSRAIRNYVAGRSPIPQHRIEMLRLLALEISVTQGNPLDDMTADETPVVPNIEPDPTSPDVPPSELFAWVGVHAPRVGRGSDATHRSDSTKLCLTLATRRCFARP
jgi:hypothetical protein